MGHLHDKLLVDENLFLKIAWLIIVKLPALDGMLPDLMCTASQRYHLLQCVPL